MSVRRIFIPDHVVAYETMRSGGPGGQGVNTTDSAVRARVNIWRLSILTHDERRRVAEKLRAHLTSSGELMAKIQTTRSQHENKRLAKERLEFLVAQALHVPEMRTPTKPTRSSREARLGGKKHLAKKKAYRRTGDEE